MPISRRLHLPSTDPIDPPCLNFSAAEKRIIAKHQTPLAVQQWLNKLPYNDESSGETLRSFRGVTRHNRAHCLEAALAAAVILEQHSYPPLVLSFESVDLLDHVIFVYRAPTGWGSIARSRDPGLHGRKPVFATPRSLVLSYVDAYVDFTGTIKAYAVVDLRVLGNYDWRLSVRNTWKVEQTLLKWPHRPLRTSPKRVRLLRARYRTFRETYGFKPWKYYRGKENWTELPAYFKAQG